MQVVQLRTVINLDDGEIVSREVIGTQEMSTDEVNERLCRALTGQSAYMTAKMLLREFGKEEARPGSGPEVRTL